MPFQQQDPLGAIQGIGGAGGANPLLGFQGLQGMQGMQGMGQLGAMPGVAGLPGQAGGVTPFGQQDMFNASPEMQEEMQAQQMKMLRIQQLTQEIQLLEIQKQQQLQNNDEQGAAATDVKIQADKKELAQLMGTDGQQQQQQAGAAAPADMVNPNGNAGAMGGGGGGGGGVPEVGGGGGGGGTGGGGGAGGGEAVGGGGGDAGGNLNAPVTDAGGANVDVSGDLEAGGAAGIPEKYKDNPMAQLIWQESKKAGADPYAMLATAVVESNLNPKAVGDNGTSFGLYQYHQGGALGNRSAEWAFNPKNIIQDEAKRFAAAGVKNGAGAAAVQRPADPSGYATKVNNVIADMKK